MAPLPPDPPQWQQPAEDAGGPIDRRREFEETTKANPLHAKDQELFLKLKLAAIEADSNMSPAQKAVAKQEIQHLLSKIQN
jgi:hypothetical protein